MSFTAGAVPILVAAEELFATRGYDGVSIQQIAHKAGISKATIYHHFSSKNELYLAVLKYALQDMNGLLAELNSIEGTPKEQFAHFSSEHLKQLNLKSNISRLILREMLDGNGSRGRELAQQVFSDYFTRLRDLLAKGQDNGDIRDDIDADQMAIALAGINVFLFQSWTVLQHLPGDAFQDQQSSGALMFELLFNGFTAPGDQK